MNNRLPKRTLLNNAKWAALIMMLALTIAELSARSVGFGHPLLYKASVAGYELVPRQTIDRLGKITHINALGTRGPETTAIPAEGVYRILTLGDSVANGGTQINDQQTWPLQLERALVAAGKPIEVINAGVAGWSTQNEAAWLKEHGTFGAKLIVLEINEKDLDQAFAGPELLDANVAFPTHDPPSALGELITRYILPRLGQSIVSADPGSTAGSFQPQNIPAELNAVEEVRTMAEANGAKLAILYWDLRIPPSVEVIPARDQLFAYAAKQAITVIRPNLNRNRRGDHFFHDDIHPNNDGNTAIANELCEHLPL